MNNKKVISRKNLPSRFPLGLTLIVIFLLDYYNCPGWSWGVSITILVIAWIFSIIGIFESDEIDLFEENKINEKKSFKERINEKTT